MLGWGVEQVVSAAPGVIVVSMAVPAFAVGIPLWLAFVARAEITEVASDAAWAIHPISDGVMSYMQEVAEGLRKTQPITNMGRVINPPRLSSAELSALRQVVMSGENPTSRLLCPPFTSGRQGSLAYLRIELMNKNLAVVRGRGKTKGWSLTERGRRMILAGVSPTE